MLYDACVADDPGGVGDAVHAGLDISRWSLLCYASYVLLASFVLVNVLIGVVLTSLDEARDMDRTEPPAAPPRAAVPPPAAELPPLHHRIEEARRAPDALEQELTRSTSPSPPPDQLTAMPTPRQG